MVERWGVGKRGWCVEKKKVCRGDSDNNDPLREIFA